MNIVWHEVQLTCEADHIPEEIVFDLTGLDIGDSIHISDLKLPANVQAAVSGDVVVATLVGASAQMSQDAAADEETAGPTAEGGAA